MIPYDKIQRQLRARPKTWLVTGCGGFIGSHLIQKLLQLEQTVVGLDNFSTGHRKNLTAVEKIVGPTAWKNFKFVRGDIRSQKKCQEVCAGADYVLHQAAVGSVPWSVEDPIRSNESNVTGFLNMCVAARDAKVKKFVYASSSAVYGDEASLPKVEQKIGRPLSPYAVTKYVNELYAEVFGRCYGFQTIGLRYFNVFGPRQDPNGPYAAVIPRWIASMEKGEPISINGDGETSRDFCYIANVVQANILAARAKDSKSISQVFNVACNEQTTLNQLFALLREALARRCPNVSEIQAKYKAFRAGDVRHSLADIKQSEAALDYVPTHSFQRGLEELVNGEDSPNEGNPRPLLALRKTAATRSEGARGSAMII